MAGVYTTVTKSNNEIVAVSVEANDAQNYENCISLLEAAANGRKEIVEIILKARAKIHVVDKDDSTRLHHAIMYGHTKIVEILLITGTNINDVDSLGNTPLHKATMYGDTEIVEILLKAGANINILGYLDATPLHEAAMKGPTKIVEILLKAGANVNAVDCRKETPLHKAADNGHTEIVEILLTAGANINAQDDQKKTPLHLAAAEGKKEIVEALLDAGAICNAECERGHTPLYYSDMKRHTEVSQYLREHGAKGGYGFFQALLWGMDSSFFKSTLSHKQTTKIVHVRSESLGAASRQTDHTETTEVSSESRDIRGGEINDKVFYKDQSHGERRSESTTPCRSESRGNNFSLINDSQQSATSDQSTGLSLQEGEDIRQQVADHWGKFSLQHKGQQGHCSSDVTSVVKEGNITVIHSPVNIKFIKTTTNNYNYQPESLQISHAEIVNMEGTVNVAHREDVHSDNESEDSDNEF